MKAFDNKYLKRIVFSIQLISMMLIMIVAYTIQLIPMKYLIYVGILFVLLLIGEYFLIFYKKERSKRSLITQIISMILSCTMVVGAFYIYKTGQVVDLMTESKFQKRAISVIVLKDSEIKNQDQLPKHKTGYISAIDSQTMTYVTDEIKKDIGSIQLKDYKDFTKLVKGLYDKQVDAIILDEAFRSLVEQTDESFSDDTRVIYQVTKDEAAVSAKNVNVTEKPFLVFVSGNDEYGALSAVSRSDVNMLIGINPKTHQILLISIPRDTYYPLHMNGQLDKFTHAGIYGLQESVNTLQDMINEDINYYVKMNFTSFINIVDALGGITVNSPAAFTTKIGKYEIKEGENHLNAKQALSFVRERKSFVDGDFARGRNQQRMISAIVKKVCSPAILTSFSAVLDTVSQSVETNFSSSEINSLVQLQLSDMPNWDIQSYQIIGEPNKLPCYSMGGVSASVVQPSATSIQQATQYIDALMSNQKVQTESGDLNQ
ncbi:LCP family protein [Candidatus Stoquefichus massiliensis]|uniref:LCP family protein n=1 Tax=Candidatus Stoquefichus massiliensis TaxID=1470350 RepID=UPI0004848690|nr:LCP family protein [Candidatus Stoquefichus massiliensis]